MQQPPPPGYAGDLYYARQMGASPVPQDAYHTTTDAPIGQAIEMDERTGSPPGPSSPNLNGPGAFAAAAGAGAVGVGAATAYGLRDSDADVNGMVGLQQGGFDDQNRAPHQQVAVMRGESQRESGPRSPTSIYSGDQ